MHPAAPAGYTAGTQSNLDLSGILSLNSTISGFNYFPAFVMEKILENIGNTLYFNVPVSHVIDLNNRSNSTAAKASNLLQGELTFRVSILAFPDKQFAAEGIMHQFGTLDMTGRADTDTDYVLPDRGVSELGIEGRYACNGSGRYIRDLAGPPQGRFWKIVIFPLNSMQNGDNIASFSADFIDNLVNKRVDAFRL